MEEVDNINERMAGMGIEDAENSQLFFDEEAEEVTNKFDTCLVGRFLTEKGLNVRAMKSKMADIWRPARGISVKDLKPGVYLFQFFHLDDMEWAMNGGPWSFDGAMLVLNRVGNGEDPLEVPLTNLQFWIQLYGVPPGLMTEAAGRQLGNFFGSFISYDPNNNSSIWRECMRIRISVDVRQPLKRKKKICKKNGTECMVQCKYERLGDFCFVCGHVSHTERFCSVKLSLNIRDEARDWGSWLRAPARRAANQDRSKFLRDERDVDWDVFQGKSNFKQHVSGEGGNQIVQSGMARRNFSNNSSNLATNQGFNSTASDDTVLAANFKSATGPNAEELIGLNIEERNKRRRGPDTSMGMDVETNNGIMYSGAGLSHTDCPTSSTTILATLAGQASQPQ